MAVTGAMEAGPIQFGDEMVTLWGPLAREECRQVMQRCRDVVSSTIARVDAELHGNDLDMDLLF